MESLEGKKADLHSSREVPLAVDLDGTLISTDLIEESLLRYILERPWRVFMVIWYWLVKGRAFLKQEVAKKIKIDVTLLPYRTEVLEYLNEEKKSGRKLLLVSGSEQVLVSAVAAHCRIFDEAKGSDGVTNCIGSAKADWLQSQFGDAGYDYVGNSRVDLRVWKRARSAIVVSSNPTLGSELPNVIKRIEVTRHSTFTLIRAMRVYQWVKALLVFIPLIAAHQIFNVEALVSAILAFFSFCTISSFTYILNDLVDVESDRANHNKKSRPFAAGEIRPFYGIALALVLLIISVLIAANISLVFLFLVLSYALGTLCYSLFAKSWVIADIVLLAGFYTIRILAGGVACNITVSKWLLLFSVFFFLGLACIKRFCELASISSTAISRRDYRKEDQPLIRVMGVCSGFIAVLVVALWANSVEAETIYPSPQFLWLLCPIFLFWIGRVWIFAERGILHHDPVMFALRDRVTYLVGGCAAILAYLATTLNINSFTG